MIKYVIQGRKPLNGEVTISGAKNAAVAIIPAAILSDGPCVIENIPKIIDVTLQLEILREMGMKVRLLDNAVAQIECGEPQETQQAFDLMCRIRSSYYLIGAMLGRYHHAKVAMPGGCNFGGIRPIDQHVKGFRALGAEVVVEDGYILADAPDGLRGAPVYLDVASVGATINILLAAVLAEGNTVIENAAREPHIVDVANFLNRMGADIKGAGTNVIKVRGVQSLAGGGYSIIPDQIEAGTYRAAGAATGGQVLVKNIIPKHMECITAKLTEMGVEVDEYDDALLVRRTGPLRSANIKTMPYPGFPTDMQPQIATALCLAEGTSMITEGVWKTRYRYVEELKRMGAKIQVEDSVAMIEGVPALKGTTVRAFDLRAGAAMVIAGLAAQGVTVVEQVTSIERGYENIVEKLSDLGADIYRLEIPNADCGDNQEPR